jgi:hypothetical protein
VTEFDLTVTWRRGDGSTIDLPATICYASGPPDAPELRTDAVALAVEANRSDFPEDLDDGSVPIRFVFDADA